VNGELTIRSATVEDDGSSLHLRIVVHNPASRTRHVYASFRALHYDPATRALRVQMSDHGLVELRNLRGPATAEESSATFLLPDLQQVSPESDAELSLRLPRTTVHVDPTQTSGPVLRLQTDNIHEARTVQVDVAWGESPFYSDPRRPYEMRAQLTDWTGGVAQHVITRPVTHDDSAR
jgi:hypothetical protein